MLEINAFINWKSKTFQYNGNVLTEDEQLFVDFNKATRRFFSTSIREFIINALKKATIELDIKFVCTSTPYSYFKNMIIIKDIIFDKDVVKNIIKEINEK